MTTEILPNVNLIPTSPTYAPLWHKWRSEPNSQKFNPILESTVESLRDRMAGMSSNLTKLEDKEYQWFVEFKGQLVGTVSLKNISFSMGYAEIGYGIGEEFQGQGIGTASVSKLLERVFSETNLRRLLAYVAESNIASCKILQKLGFRREGHLREHYLIQGKPHDEVLFGLLRTDYQKREVSVREKVGSTAPFTIRQLTDSDFDQVRVLLSELDDFHRRELPQYFKKPEPPSRTIEEFSGWLRDPNAGVFGAELNGKIAGFAYCFYKVNAGTSLHQPRNFGVLDALVVSPSFRNAGIGAALTREAEKWAKSMGATQMELSVWAFNTEATRFYESLGYRNLTRKMGIHL